MINKWVTHFIVDYKYEIGRYTLLTIIGEKRIMVIANHTLDKVARLNSLDSTETRDFCKELKFNVFYP